MLAALFGVAWDKAVSGDRCGPVLIDMPMYVQRGELSATPNNPDVNGRRFIVSSEHIHHCIKLINGAQRPIILAGTGCLSAVDELRECVNATNIPVVASLPAVGILPTNAPRYLGMIGHTGHPDANKAVQNADLVIVLGARLDMRQTGTETKRFTPNARIIRIDTSTIELTGSRIRAEVIIQATCRAVLMRLLERRSELKMLDNPVRAPFVPDANDKVAQIIRAISKATPAECIFTTGVGAHQQTRGALAYSGLSAPHVPNIGGDLDWCMRFRQKGWRILFVPSARVTHVLGACSRSHPVFVEWHKHKGMMRFYRKFFRHQYPGILMGMVAMGIWLRFGLVATYYTAKRIRRALERGRD